MILGPLVSSSEKLLIVRLRIFDKVDLVTLERVKDGAARGSEDDALNFGSICTFEYVEGRFASALDNDLRIYAKGNVAGDVYEAINACAGPLHETTQLKRVSELCTSQSLGISILRIQIDHFDKLKPTRTEGLVDSALQQSASVE